MGQTKRFQRLALSLDLQQGWVHGQVHVKASGRIELRHQKDIHQRGGLSEGEANGAGRELGLQRGQTLAHPVPCPAGAVATELSSHNRPEIREQLVARFGSIERMQSADIADAIVYIVTRPRHMAVNEMLIRPTEQTW